MKDLTNEQSCREDEVMEQCSIHVVRIWHAGVLSLQVLLDARTDVAEHRDMASDTLSSRLTAVDTLSVEPTRL